MPLIEWNDSFSVKIDSIDEQHKKLVDLLNSLNEEMVQGTGQNALKKILGDVVAYTQYHFKYEEDLMEETEYPDFEVHCCEHIELINRTLTLYSKLGNGDYRLTIETMQFLRDWLNNHIMVMDMKYSQLMIDKGIK